jgi:hypothetical protein
MGKYLPWLLISIPPLFHPFMTSTAPAAITIGELEANYSLYCKALKILVSEGRSLKKIQRTVCWNRLETLHNCLPKRYKAPDYLVLCLQREWQAKQGEASQAAAIVPPVG